VSLGFALSLLLFAGACAGHATLLVALHNALYGGILSRPLSHALRCLTVLAGPLGIVLFLRFHGFDVLSALPFRPDAPLGWPLSLYLVACLLAGFVLLPAVLVRDALRRPPAALASNHGRVIDVAAELGYTPLGKGHARYMARLPGNECFQVELAERTFHLDRLPAAWDGLTILHLSDLHLQGTPDKAYFRYVMDQCAAWEPDLVALTGDLVDSDWHHRWIVPLLGRLRWRLGAFAILGNHDEWRDPPLIRRRLRKIGMQVLGNSWTEIEVRGERLVVIGQEEPWFRPGPDLSGCPEGVFRLCLSHTPDHIAWARRHGIDLVLAGHNHGGQVRLPLLGPLLVPSRYGRRYASGSFHEPPTVMHVSRGLGGEEPLRYNCRPEVTLLILRPLLERVEQREDQGEKEKVAALTPRPATLASLQQQGRVRPHIEGT
jgi:predicted MPP superfamily phosphohydrolase